MKPLFCAMILSAIIVFAIHCSIWYYSLSPSARRALDEDMDGWL